MTCTADDCLKPPHALGLCGTHYQRLRRNGAVMLTPPAPKPCYADGCDRWSYCRGLCTLHYSRLRLTGSLLDPRPQLLDRLRERTEVHPSGCWLWTGGLAANGYGRLSVDGRLTYAHRAAYEIHVGPIPDDLTIDHLCMVRRCINPDHLEPVTRAENSRREMQARRTA